MSIATVGAAGYIYFEGWRNWNYAKARRTFVFSETNFYNNKNYACFFLQPISYESEFFFWVNVLPLFYASVLVERNLGVFYWGGAYLFNCSTSALSQIVYQRHIGYKEVQRRGRMSNNNGNLTLFFTSLFSAIAPHYRIFGGGQLTTVYFWHILLAVMIIYFTGKSYTSPSHGRHGKSTFYTPNRFSRSERNSLLCRCLWTHVGRPNKGKVVAQSMRQYVAIFK